MFSSRGSSNFANNRPLSASEHSKNFAGQGPTGVSVRISRGPSHSSNPYTAQAYFDVGYHDIDGSHQPRRTSWFNMIPDPTKHFHFPGHGNNTSRGNTEAPQPRPKTSSFSIYPGLSKDRFIYEASNSEFSSSSTSLTPLPFSPALSTDSIDTLRSPDSPIDEPLPSQNRPPSRSSTTTPAGSNGASTFPLHIPALAQAQSQSQSSYIPFMTSEPQSELDQLSRNTEMNAGNRYHPEAGGNPHSAIPIPMEHRDIPTQIYRDMPLRSSPEPREGAAFGATAGPGNARESSPSYSIPHSRNSIPFNQSPSEIQRRRSSYFPPVIPPGQLEPSISQSTTSTLDPNHPLLAPPAQEPVSGLFEGPRSDSEGSTATLESIRRSPPQSYTRSRRDSGVDRHLASSTMPPGIGISSVNPVTTSGTAQGSPGRSRVESFNVSSTAQYHQSSPPLPHSHAQPPVVPSTNTFTTPVAQGQSSFPPPHVPSHLHPAVPAANVNIPPNTVPPPRSRPQAVTITTVSESGSSASERTLDDSPPPTQPPVLMLDTRQRNSNNITSTPAHGSGAPVPAGRTRTTSLSGIPPPVFNMAPPQMPTRLSPNSLSQVNAQVDPRASRTPSPPQSMNSNPMHVMPPAELRSRTPGPKRSHSDSDNPIYAAATLRSATPFRTEFAPNVANPPSNSMPPPPPEPRRRYSDEQQTFSRAPVRPTIDTMPSRTVRWNKDLICPSPILACHRRKGWFNRRGDQLWTNGGSYRTCPTGQEYPPDLDSYPEFGEGWMNEEGVKIDMMHRLIPKVPKRSALKQPRAANHA
ncbi:hypothetical protein V5O48_003223 [Marasmius crinis-equi]|uniref:Uncharacterized protein n=1 Tax=Marasmius crinis-equi TaxID=585013 RepID=A0ABR3FTV8_9AGAR